VHPQDLGLVVGGHVSILAPDTGRTHEDDDHETPACRSRSRCRSAPCPRRYGLRRTGIADRTDRVVRHGEPLLVPAVDRVLPGVRDRWVTVSPSPCITTSETQRYAENHAYRQRVPITATQTAQAAPRAAALLTALTKLSASRTADEAALRSAVVKALGLTANGAEIKGTEAGAPLRYVEVGGGAGRVCVNGAIDGQGKAATEVVGRTLEGTCLEGDGGH
jgi:hypothetical protein